MTLFQSLQQRAFALLWSGQTISRLGDSLYQMAIAWFVVEKTGSARAMGNLLIFAFAPKILFLLLGGVVVDRLPRLKVMLVADLLRGLLTMTVALLAFANQLELWQLYLASILFGISEAFFEPAGAALLPELVRREKLASANSLNNLSANLIGISGPALGALVVAWGGVATAFALDALSFLVSAVCLLQIVRFVKPSATSQGHANLFKELREGFTTVCASTWLWLSLIVFALLNFTGRSPMQVALPFLVKVNLHADVNTLGLLYSVFSLGSILGAVVIGRLPAMQRRGLIIYSGLFMTGLMTIVLGLPVMLPGAVIAIFGMGAALAVSNLVWGLLIQDRVPAAVLGRVSSINLLGSNGLLPFGFGLAGWASDQLGPAPVFVIGGLLTTLLAFIGLVQPAIRRLD